MNIYVCMFFFCCFTAKDAIVVECRQCDCLSGLPLQKMDKSRQPKYTVLWESEVQRMSLAHVRLL